jgi:hypothetical protein
VDRPVLPVLIVALSVALAAAGCGGTTTRVDRGVPGRPAAGALPDSAVEAMRLDRARAQHLGTFHGRGVWLAPTADGETCLLEAAADGVGAACGASLFGTHGLAFTEATEGGPPPRPLTLVRVTGVAKPGVRSVVVELSDGSSAPLVPNDRGAFVYAEPADQLAAGVRPTALIARNGAAGRVDRVDLPRAPFSP